jgi:hypothetical protein
MGLKQGTIGNTLGEHIGNLIGTSTEHVQKKGKNEKKILPPHPTPKLKRK